MTTPTIAETLSDQTAALALLLRIAGMHPTLPTGDIRFSQYYPGRIDVLLNNPAEVEAWRAALLVSDSQMTLHELPGRPALRLDFCAVVGDAEVYAWTAFELADQQQCTEGTAA
ncbi:hypothetical protein [Streptomyces sp. NPDC006193]|uniref:hypothetical protein n=1 Tax=Streptomyces sp. NPDC006193 TaxID=3155717 RepID=UPI0033AEA09E